MSNFVIVRVLVTGSSRGIGKAIALKLAEDGWDVAVHFSGNDVAAREVEKILGPRCAGVFQADLANPDSANALMAGVGEIQALVNNAGIYEQVDFVGADSASLADHASRTFAINFLSPMWLCRAAAQQFESRGEGGKIVNVASRVGFKGESNASIYAASKAALINLTRSLAVELAPKDIGVFAIAPGWVDTAMARSGMDARLGEIISTLPLGRMASPQDCASAVAFLLSEGASYLSGQTIDINGASYFH